MPNPLVGLIKRIKSKNETESGAELDDLATETKKDSDNKSNDEYSDLDFDASTLSATTDSEDTSELDVFDDEEDEEAEEIETDVQKPGKFRSFFRRIKENAEDAKTKRKHNVQHINQSIFNKDILFNTDKILKDTKQQAERKEVKVDDSAYIAAAIENDLAELEKQKDKLLKEYKKTEPEWDNLKEDKAIEKILKRASEKAAWLKENEEERAEGLDYTDEALKQALGNDDSDENKKLIELARQKHHAGIISRMSIIDGINQVFKDFHREKGEDQKAVSFATSENDAKIMQDAINNRYNYEALTQRAIKISLQRAKAKAAYLSANDADYDDKKDYVKEALEKAKSALGGNPGQFEAQPEYKDITKERYEEIIAKAEQEYRNEQEEHAKAEKNRFNIDVRVQEGLGDLKKQKEELENATKEETDENIKKYYQAKLEELAKQMAEKKLEIRRQVQQEEKAKADEEANRAQKAIDDAFTRAEANWEKKNQQQENQQSKNSSKKVDSKPKQSQEVAEKNVLDAFFKSIEPTKGKTISSDDSDFYDDDGYSPYDYPLSRSTELSEKDNENNYEKIKKALQNIRSVKDMRNIINSDIEYLKNEIFEQTVDIKDEKVIGRLKARHKNRETKRNQLQAINQLEESVKRHFQLHGISLAYYESKKPTLPDLNEKLQDEELKGHNPEEYQKIKKEAREISNASLGYVIGMSTLLDKLDASFVTALNRFKGTEQETYIKKMREHLHAPLFRDLGTEYLLNHKMTVTDKYGNTIKDENGEDKLFSAYVQKNRSYGHSLMRSDSSAKTTIGNHFRATLRTLINVCRVHTKSGTSSSDTTVDAIEKSAQELLRQPLKSYAPQKIQDLANKFVGTKFTDEMVRAIGSNSTSGQKTETADKFKDVRDLLLGFAKGKIDEETLQEKQKEINSFSGKSNLNLNKHIYEETYNKHLQL